MESVTSPVGILPGVPPKTPPTLVTLPHAQRVRSRACTATRTPGAAGGEVRREATTFGAVASNAAITAGDEHADATDAQLLELGVDARGVVEAHALRGTQSVSQAQQVISQPARLMLRTFSSSPYDTLCTNGAPAVAETFTSHLGAE
jgi:hypothetical protein